MNRLIAQLWPRIAVTLLLILSHFTVTAGSTSNSNPELNLDELMAFSKQVEMAAANKGARAFILARVGQPAADIPVGIKYTHVGLAVYSQVTTEDNQILSGYAIYNLYQNEQDLSKSHLEQNFPVDFFSQAHTLKTSILIPTPLIQNRLIELVQNNQYRELHNPNYSVIANPFNTQFQNCTEFILDLVNVAIYQTTDIAQLKANTEAHFKPQPISINRLKLRLAAMFTSDVALKDHRSKVKTTTFTTIAQYLKDNDLLVEQLDLSFEQPAAPEIIEATNQQI